MGLIGTIPNSDTDAVRSSLKAHPELELEEVFTSETEHGYVILYRSGDRVAVQELLETMGSKNWTMKKSRSQPPTWIA